MRRAPLACDFEVEDAIATASHCSDTEGRLQKPWGFWADLRHIERQRDPPWQATITTSTDRDVEAPFSVDESRDVVPYIAWDPVQPGEKTGPFLLIVRTGRIVTAHLTHPMKGV